MGTGIDDDALRLVFEEFTCGEPWKWPDAEYDQNVAQRPFLLAAVSRRWRTLALETATIWTYFGFPGDAELYPKHSERLRVLLTASKNALVDINVTLGTPYDFNNAIITQSAKAGVDVLEALGRIGLRWRNVRFRLPSEATSHLRPALESPMPNLISLSAVTSVEWNMLPLAPQLEQLYVEWDAFSARSEVSLPSWHYPALSSFAVMGESLAIAISTQNLDTLTHVSFIHDMHHPPKDPLQFPQLLSLVLDDARFLPHIRAPRLLRLGVSGSGHFDSLHNFSGFATVESLALFGYVGDDVAKSLWAMSSVQMLDFHTPVCVQTCFIRDTEYAVSASFFCSLNEDPRGLTWPLLRGIRFRKPNRDGAASGCDDYDLLEFVRKRNTKYALAQQTARIQEIILDHPDAISQDTAEAVAELATLRETYYVAT